MVAMLADSGLMTVAAPSTLAPLSEDRAERIYGELSDRGSKSSVSVDFRELVPGVGATERATHAVHPYPAKILRHIPALMVSAPQVCPPGAVVLDPFCGSGTTLVESLVASRSAVGLDINPLAALIARVKTTPVEASSLLATVSQVVQEARALDVQSVQEPRLFYWYHESSLQDLLRLRHAISTVESPKERDLLLVALSLVARDISLANPRVSVPVRLRPEAYPARHELRKKMTDRLESIESIDVFSAFEHSAKLTERRVGSLASVPAGVRASVHVVDTRELARATGDVPAAISVDTVITSPPYLGAQKYIRASSLNLLCLGLADSSRLSDLTSASIGREHFRQTEYDSPLATGLSEADSLIEDCRAINPLRAHLAATYLEDMRSSIKEVSRLLRPGGAFVLIAGGNTLCGLAFPTPRYLKQLCLEQHLTLELQLVDAIRSRGLMTRRNRKASPIATESVMVFRK